MFAPGFNLNWSEWDLSGENEKSSVKDQLLSNAIQNTSQQVRSVYTWQSISGSQNKQAFHGASE